MPGAELKHFTINQNTNKEASEAWDRWKRNGVNISDKICQLIKQARKQEILSEQYGGQTPAEAFCNDNNEYDDNVIEELFAFLPKIYEPLTEAHMKKLISNEQVLTLYNALRDNQNKMREYFDIQTKYSPRGKIVGQEVRRPSTLLREKKESELELLRQKLVLTLEEQQKREELVNIFLNGSFAEVVKLVPEITEENLNFFRQSPTETWRFKTWAREIIIRNRDSRAAAVEKLQHQQQPQQQEGERQQV
jgi:hypothetical protein